GLGLASNSIALDLAGVRAYVLNECGTDQNCESDGTISVIDTASDTVVDTWTINPTSRSIVAHPNAHRLYVGGLHGVEVVDTTTGERSPLSPYEAQQLAIDTSGVRLYYSSNDLVRVIDTVTEAPVDAVAVGHD